jgi:hypothetical protein
MATRQFPEVVRWNDDDAIAHDRLRMRIKKPNLTYPWQLVVECNQPAKSHFPVSSLVLQIQIISFQFQNHQTQSSIGLVNGFPNALLDPTEKSL